MIERDKEREVSTCQALSNSAVMALANAPPPGREYLHPSTNKYALFPGCVCGVWVCVCVDVWMWYGSMECQIKRKEFVSISYYSRAGQDRVDGINV